MAKLSVSSLTKDLGGHSIKLAAVLAGMIASKKFIDLSKLPGVDKITFIQKNTGLVKVLAGLLLMGKFKKIPYIDQILTGIALEGGLSFVRNITASKDAAGKQTYLFDQLGAGADTDPYNLNKESSTPDPDENSNVAGEGDAETTSDGVAGVAGMGEMDPQWE